nr:lipase family protein [Cohnella zeiphila]
MPVRTVTYDSQKALWLAAVCYQTYRQYTDPNGDYARPAGFRTVADLAARSLGGDEEPFGFVLESPDEAVVAFRGTSSASDWLSDALAVQTDYPYVYESGQTHLGFTGIYRSARDQVQSALDRIRPGKRLYVTGHSLGAALAVLCSLDAAVHSSFDSPILYTFGSPRVGDPDFVRSFAGGAGSFFRVSNLYDAVTYLPPTTFKLPRLDQAYEYRHIPGLVTLEFNNGSMSSNHVIGSYFAALSKLDPAYARRLRESEPDFCPPLIGENGSNNRQLTLP